MARENKQDKSEEKVPKRRDDMRRDFLSRFFDDDFWMEQFETWRTPLLISALDRRWFPRTDVSESDTEVRIIADVPGIDPEDIEIDVRGDRLAISGKSERETKSDERPYRYERSFGEFRRELRLPARVREDEVQAVCKDGVLTITLLKTESERRNKIKIVRK